MGKAAFRGYSAAVLRHSAESISSDRISAVEPGRKARVCSWAVLYVGIRHVGEVALEQQAPWGRPPFGALVQLCFGTARGLSVAIAYLLSNRAEKPVCAPGPCCTLEFAVPSRPGGQQPK